MDAPKGFLLDHLDGQRSRGRARAITRGRAEPPSGVGAHRRVGVWMRRWPGNTRSRAARMGLLASAMLWRARAWMWVCGLAASMRRQGLSGLNTHPRPARRGGRGPVAHEDHCVRQWDQGGLDRVWITDFTYLRCAQGWVYLCAVRDAHSRRVLGYAMGEQQSTDLVITALDMAATTRGGFPTGVVLHADRGTQFTSEKLAAYMRAVQGRVSMGRAGVCWDNAMAESFWATLKTEYYYRRTFTTRDQVYTGVATWIEDFYNRRRIHTSLGGTSPIEYELHQAAWTTAAKTNRQQLAHNPTCRRAACAMRR